MIANTTKLRLLAIRRNATSRGELDRTLDLPIVAWVDRDGRPWPVVVAALDPDDVLRIWDADQKCWFSLDGEMFTTYAAASSEAWKATKPTPEPIREPQPVGLTVPSVGAVIGGEPYGVGQSPIGHRPTSGPRSPSREQVHPRDRSDG